jgi:hypothetical protein
MKTLAAIGSHLVALAITLAVSPAHIALAEAPTPGTLLTRTLSGAQKGSGLEVIIHSGVVPQWPVELASTWNLRWSCWVFCSTWHRLELALARAGDWMAAFPEKSLRFDAAMALSQIRQTVDSDALRRAFERARAMADRDNDHPHRRFWVPNLPAPVEFTSRWQVPGPGEERVNSNRVVSEALFCADYGFRPETLRYVCGPMRDDGGYQTTHALWALGIAHQNGCVPDADFEPCARAMQRELLEQQPTTFTPHATLDIDLYAERLLYSVMTGIPDPVVNQWARTLLDLQHSDGSWGIAATGEDPYFRYHATMVSTWALAEWYRRVVGHPGVKPADAG